MNQAKKYPSVSAGVKSLQLESVKRVRMQYPLTKSQILIVRSCDPETYPNKKKGNHTTRFVSKKRAEYTLPTCPVRDVLSLYVDRSQSLILLSFEAPRMEEEVELKPVDMMP